MTQKVLETDKYRARVHLAIYVLTTLAISALFYEQAQLAHRAGVQSVDAAQLVVQQVILGLLGGLLLAGYGWIRNRRFYALSALLFAGYSATRLAAAFTETLGLVPKLESIGIPVSDYQGTFYLLALTAAVSYLITILLLRQTYGKLDRVRQRTIEN